MRKYLTLPSIMKTAPAVLLLVILTFLTLVYTTHNFPGSAAYLSPAQTVTYAALPSTIEVFEGEVESEDARTEIVRQFFEKHDSPLEPYAEEVVEKADEYDLDFRLIPAIAMQESNLCKKIPADSNNCWGYGIYGDNVVYFEDYIHGIETVTKTLATKYKESGLESPEEIMRRYTPSSNGSWANGVNFFLEELR